MRFLPVLALSSLPTAAAAFLFVGIERHLGEHEDGYSLFIKQVPTLTAVYVNTVACGTCDVPPFEGLSPERRPAFGDYCRVRFGLDDIRACYAIFWERQAILNEKL